MTPVEERIDHEELCEHGVLPSLMGGRLCCKKCFDALLTEHSAREERVREILDLDDMSRSDYGAGLRPEDTLAAIRELFDPLPATEPAQPEEEPRDGR